MKTVVLLLAFIAFGAVAVAADEKEDQQLLQTDSESHPKVAIAYIEGSQGKLRGNVTFTQIGQNVEIRVFIAGLDEGKHGFHVHERGDLPDGCLTKPGVDIDDLDHGAPVESFGNVVANASGFVDATIQDGVVALAGPRSIIGLAIVVHFSPDQLGAFDHDHPVAKRIGNAVDRAGYGDIMDWPLYPLEQPPRRVC